MFLGILEVFSLLPTACLTQSGRDSINNLFHKYQSKAMNNTNIKKQFQLTAGLIQRSNNNIQLLSIGVIVSGEFCFRKRVCLLFTSLSCAENNFFPNR